MNSKFLSIVYQPSDCKQKQGNRASIQHFLDDGYFIQDNRNGYWILVRPARALVTIANEKTTRTFNMKTDICVYYSKSRISKALCEKFESDAKKGIIKFELDSERNSYSFR